MGRNDQYHHKKYCWKQPLYTWLTVLRFNVPLNTKQVILETFLSANLLDSTQKIKN